MVGDFGDMLTMPWGTSKCSSSVGNDLGMEIDLGGASMLEVEEDEA